MRNREAWLAAIATALGISEEACRRDAAPQVQQVASAAASSSAPVTPVVEATATASASTDVATSAVASASATPSATASAIAKPAHSVDSIQGLCGASAQNPLNQLTLNASCGLSVNPGTLHNASCGATVNTGIGRSGSCGGTAARPPETTRPTAVIAVTAGGSAPGDERTVNALRPRFRACANQGLAQDPSMQGRLAIVVAVAANGEVTKADVASNSGLSANVAQCMLRGVKNTQFSVGAARTITLAIIQTKQSP